MKKFSNVTFTLITTFYFCVIMPPVTAQELVGKVLDLNSREHLYTEKHTYPSNEGERSMVSRYLSPQGDLIAKRTVTFQGEQVAKYELKVVDGDYIERIERQSDALKFFIKEGNSKASTEFVKVEDKTLTIIDAGANDHILRNWDTLLAGNAARFYFPSITKKDIFKVQVTHDKKASTDELAVFTMTAANALIRLLIKPVKIGFYRGSKQLAYYRGPSNLKDEDGKAYKIEIEYADDQV